MRQGPGTSWTVLRRAINRVTIALLALLALLAAMPVALGLGEKGSRRAVRADSPWTAPSSLAGCAGAAPVRVVFPASSPFAGSGPGAIVSHSPGGGCAGRAAAGVAVTPVSSADAPGAARIWGWPAGSAGSSPTAVAGAADGSVVVAAALTRARSQQRGTIAEGRADGPLATAGSLPGPGVPVAATSAYLGDVALASLLSTRGGEQSIQMRIQRHFAAALGAPVTVADHQRGVTMLTIGLDYRTDAIVAWRAGGWLYARWVREGGVLGSLQRVARVGPGVQITATISDDDRAILVWLDQPGPGAPASAARELIDVSAFGVRFGAPRLIESFSEPPGMILPVGAVRLTRLSRESVMLAWTGMTAGRYVVRAAPVSLAGVGHASDISPPGTDSVLAAFSPGPQDEAVAVWTSAPRVAGNRDGGRVSIMASRGHPSGPAAVGFDAPEVVAPPGPNGQPDAAVDPTTDRVLVAWALGGAHPAVRFAVRAPG